MSKENIKESSTEQLKAKEKSMKVFIGIFIPLIIGLFYFVIRSYINDEEMDWSIVTIAICTLGGPAILYPELKEIQNELRLRS